MVVVLGFEQSAAAPVGAAVVGPDGFAGAAAAVVVAAAAAAVTSADLAACHPAANCLEIADSKAFVDLAVEKVALVAVTAVFALSSAAVVVVVQFHLPAVDPSFVWLAAAASATLAAAGFSAA